MSRDETMRILGAADGFAHALVHLRLQIKTQVDPPYQPLHPRHVRKIAEREARMKPLLMLEAFLVAQHQECLDAYDERQRAASPAPPPADQAAPTQGEG